MVLAAPLVFRAPSDPAVGRAARCARGRRPARELSAPAAQPELAIELVACGAAGVPGAVGPGRPRDRHTRACGSEWSISKPARALRTLRRPPHRRHLVADAWLVVRPGPAAAHRHRSPPVPSGALHTGGSRLVLCNFACNSLTALSNRELIALEFQRFQTLLKLLPIELHATLGDGDLVRLRWGLGA